jgi:hypothetical protein
VDDPAISMEQLMNYSPDYNELIHRTISAFGNIFDFTMDVQSIPDPIVSKEQELQP